MLKDHPSEVHIRNIPKSEESRLMRKFHKERKYNDIYILS